MRTVHVVVVLALALAAGCSKKEGDKPAAKEGEGAAAPAPAPETPPAPDPAATKPPAMTPEMLYADQPVWTVQMLDRGLWVRAASGPVEHRCRQELANVWGQNTVLRMKAKTQVGATTCEPKAGYAVCTFKNPAPDPKLDPDGLTHWVFTGTDAEPILVAILTGPQDDLDKVAPDLGKIESCPRPSDDPQ
ncbi:MAG TPA: hypothetical protein VMZ28_16865 [Kofleriaceae bacterium]|nr:hypothetical protein [Kofleriaceae bacterium]